MRELCWKMGQHFEEAISENQVLFYMVYPGRGFVSWNLTQTDDRLKPSESLCIRIHDITDIEFNGENAHQSLDIPCHARTGKVYFDTHHRSRMLISELGVQSDKGFRSLLRSKPFFFDRDHGVGDFHPQGMYIDRDHDLEMNVENIFQSDLVYEHARLRKCLGTIELNGVQMVSLKPEEQTIEWDDINQALKEQRCLCESFLILNKKVSSLSLDESQWTQTELKHLKKLESLHQHQKLQFIHAHNWPSASYAYRIAKKFDVPYFISFHQRFDEDEELSEDQLTLLRHGEFVSVSSEACQTYLLERLPELKQKLKLIPGIACDVEETRSVSSNLIQSYGLNPDEPILLFAGELAHGAGPDILIDALPEIFKEHHHLQVILVGDGPMRGDLEGRIWHAGLAHRIRFTGHLMADAFDALLSQINFLVVPARTAQDEYASREAIARGKPVLLTHQSQIRCVEHGVNGFITYDNPGSMVWGIKELLGNEWVSGKLMKAKQRSLGNDVTAESLVLNYLIQYLEMIPQKQSGEYQRA